MNMASIYTERHLIPEQYMKNFIDDRKYDLNTVEMIGLRPISEEELNDYSYSIHPQTSKTFEQYVRDECALINASLTAKKLK